MKLGIMQPYFFPYPGYFSLIKATDKWIVFDTPQFVQYSWMSRNRIIKPNTNDWMYFLVPVKKHKLKIPIHAIQIQSQLNWKEKIFAQLGHYKKHAPYYNLVLDFLHESLKDDFEYLADLNVHTLSAVCDFIGIDFNFEILSRMDILVEPASKPDEWALNICKAEGFNSYVNAEGGQSFFEKEVFQKNDIELRFLEFKNPPYDQKTRTFVPGLSIIDEMMFNTPEEIHQMLDDYQLIS